ncbi:MAG: phage integrase central domain-containing protein, partial [Actinomycetota bacterium]
MGSIERVDRPKPWRARYRTPDGRRVSQSFRRKADAEKWLLLEEGDVLAGRWHDPRSGTELFSEYCERWLEERSPMVATKTDYNIEAALRGRILPVFGGKRLKQLTTKGIRDWLTSLLAEGLSPATVKTYRQILGQILNQAVADGILTDKPVD